MPVWIDTDPSVGVKDRDVDDGIALIQAFHSPELEIRGVSAVFGNAAIEQTFPIATKIVRDFGPKNLKVYKGASHAKELGTETEASRAIASALTKEALTLLALGPVTNIGIVIKKHPELIRKIIKIIAVAGRRPGQRFTTGSKNHKAHRDFNFELDPEAFQLILDSGVPLVLTPFEISSKIWITSEDLDALDKAGPAAQWISMHSRNWLQLWIKVFGVEGFNPFDTLAIAYAVEPNLMECETLAIKIKNLPDDVSEATKKYLLLSRDFHTSKKATYCFKAKTQFKEILLKRLSL